MKKAAALIGIMIFFVVLFTYPAVFHLSDRIIGDGGDNYQFLSFQYLANKQFVNGQFPFTWMNYWRYPAGFDLSIGYDSTLLLLIGIVFYTLVNNPVVVYNLSVLCLLFLNGLFSYLFFEKISTDSKLGLLGALMYGFSFYTLARTGGHPNLLLSAFFPFFLYSLFTLYERDGDLKSFIAFSFSLTLVFLSSLQYLLIFSGSLIFLLPIIYLTSKEITKAYLLFFWKKKVQTIISLASAAGVFFLFNWGRIAAVFGHSLLLPTPEIVSVPVINYFIPNTYLQTWSALIINNTKTWIEYCVFLGFPEIVLLITFFLYPGINRKLKLFLGGTILIFFLLALGNQNSGSWLYPYTSLFAILPFRGIIEPARFYIIFYLFITTAIILLLKRFRGLGRYSVPIVFLLLMLERLPLQFYLSGTKYDRNFIQAVTSVDSRAILDLPVYTDWWNGNLYDLYSVYYRKPIVNGYLHWSGNTASTQFLTKKLKRFECTLNSDSVLADLTAYEMQNEADQDNRMILELKSYGILTIVIHKDLSRNLSECREVNKRLEILTNSSSLRKVYEDDNKLVFQLI